MLWSEKKNRWSSIFKIENGPQKAIQLPFILLQMIRTDMQCPYFIKPENLNFCRITPAEIKITIVIDDANERV